MYQRPLTLLKTRSNAKPQSGTSSILQSPKSGLKGHGCPLHLQYQGREPKFRSWVYQRPVTISTSRSRCQPQSGISSILQSPEWGLKGHGYSLDLQNQDRMPKIRTWMYQRPVTISKLRSRKRCKSPVINLQCCSKPKMRTSRTWCSLHLHNQAREP